MESVAVRLARYQLEDALEDERWRSLFPLCAEPGCERPNEFMDFCRRHARRIDL